MKIILRLTITVTILSGFLTAQDFGYEYYNILDYRTVGASYSFHNFSPLSSNRLPDSVKVRITSALPFFEYRQLGLRVAIGYNEYSIGGESKSSFSAYAESGNDIGLTGKADLSGLFLPLFVSANYVQAKGAYNGIKDFDVGSLGLGTGLKYRYFSRSFGFQVFGTAALHYATEGFSTEYGSSMSYVGETQFLFPQFLAGIMIGYRYQLQNWNMNNSDLNYRRVYHGPFIGVLF
jgi:hypothetical protein